MLGKKEKIKKIDDPRGMLCFLEDSQIPFKIKRIFWVVYPKGVRGKHSHIKTRQYLVCLQGSMTLTLDNGKIAEKVLLNNPSEAVLIEPDIWHEMDGFSDDCIFIVAASEYYDPADYIRSYNEFIEKYG